MKPIAVVLGVVSAVIMFGGPMGALHCFGPVVGSIVLPVALTIGVILATISGIVWHIAQGGGGDCEWKSRIG